MAYREYSGNLFNSEAQTLVNTVNCVGAMGKGVALEFRRRFPEMYEDYRARCQHGELRPGGILLYKGCEPWILNVAVKDHWRLPSRLPWVESCLRSFSDSYLRMGITSIAFPWIGAMNGGLPWPEVHQLMRRYLMGLPSVEIEVVEFDPSVPDRLFLHLRDALWQLSPNDIAIGAGITRRAATLVVESIRTDAANSLAELCACEGLSGDCMDRIYRFANKLKTDQPAGPQLTLLGI